MNKKPVIAVIICTYNRSALLTKAIQSLLNQSLDKTQFEIIISDDGSTDDTKQAVTRFQKKYRAPSIRYIVTHTNTGLAHSRNSIVKQLSHQYVAFIDDDATAHPEWLSRGLSYFSSLGVSVVGVTGPVFPSYNKNKPAWFKNSYEADIKGDHARFLAEGETFSGPNMILLRDAILQAGGFAQETDMKGDTLRLGEETSLFARMWSRDKKPQLYYAPDVSVYHLVHPYKMTVSYRLKRWFASGQSYVFVHRHKPIAVRFFLAGKVAGFGVYGILTGLVTIPFYRHWQQWIVERLGPVCFVGGYITTLLGSSFSMRHKGRI